MIFYDDATDRSKFDAELIIWIKGKHESIAGNEVRIGRKNRIQTQNNYISPCVAISLLVVFKM